MKVWVKPFSCVYCPQDTESVRRDKEERLQYGRYFYRFPQGESGADVYNRMVMVEEDLVGPLTCCRGPHA